MKNLYKVTCSTPYCGTDNDYWVYAPSEEYIDKDDLQTWAYENAQSYEYLATGWNDDFECEEDREDYYADCDYYIAGPYTLQDAIDDGFNGVADAEY